MKGMLGFAYTIFKYGFGAFVGFVGICVAIYMVLIVFGLLGMLIKRWRENRYSKKLLKAEPRKPFRPEALQEIRDMVRREQR